jgi:AAA domain
MLLSVKEFWPERLDESRPAPIVEFLESDPVTGNDRFILLEGSQEVELVTDSKLFEFLLCRVGAEGNPILLFDDLKFFNRVFPSRNSEWYQQPAAVLSNIALVNPVAIEATAGNPCVTLKLYKSPKFKLEVGQKFRLLKRYIDFNTPKIVRNFLEIDVNSRLQKPLVLRLLEEPNAVGQTRMANEEEFAKEETRIYQLYRSLSQLDIEAATPLIFTRSQRHAMRSILRRQATIIWGPPGTGKTHTLALSILYLLEIMYLHTQGTVIVWMTAVTNAAIHQFLRKFEMLMDKIRAIPHLQKDWLDEVSIVHLTSGKQSVVPPPGRLRVVAGTVWQLWKREERIHEKADILVIDEGGQMNIGTAALVIRWLKDNGRLIGISHYLSN